MDRLYIEKTKGTPMIDFNPDNNVLKIEGQSYPENAFKFYEPVLKWIDEFLENTQGEILIEIDFHLPYINSSSSKCIMMLLERFDSAYSDGRNIKVNWYYDADNESSLECAEEFKEDLMLPFNLLNIS